MVNNKKIWGYGRQKVDFDPLAQINRLDKISNYC